MATVYVGPTNWWWRDSPDAPSACQAKGAARIDGAAAVGKILNDGSKIICVGGGAAWIVAPASTQVGSTWAGGQYNSTLVGNKCCISEWSGLQTALTNAGFNPSDWFVPSPAQLQNPGYVCRTQWDSFSATCYWSSTEVNATCAFFVRFSDGFTGNLIKASGCVVRAFRCVTY
jgi:hypothetical protein